MTSKEKIEQAWELVNSKHIETNEEIQLVRYAVRIARELVERDTPKKPKESIQYGDIKHNCSVCNSILTIPHLKEINGCPKCLQRIDWS